MLPVHYRSSSAEADDVASRLQEMGRAAATVKADLAVEMETASLIARAADCGWPVKSPR